MVHIAIVLAGVLFCFTTTFEFRCDLVFSCLA